jgi:hypothetical protein
MGIIGARRTHPSIYLLTDHLDAALAMGEDLLSEKVALDSPRGASALRAWMRQSRNLDAFLTSVRTLEYAMTARVLQARKRAAEIKRGESRLKPLIALFVGVTGPLVDAAAEFGDTEGRDFDCADAALTFLRRRGLVDGDAAGLEGRTHLAVTEDYRLAGRIRLGTLLDLIATFLDTLDLVADLRAPAPTQPEAADAPPVEAGEGQPAGRIG